MNTSIPEALGIIAGKGAYPVLLAQSARQQGVKRLYAVAFKGETKKDLNTYVDGCDWIHVGQLQSLLDSMSKSGVKHIVMAGQITPTNLFRVRLDSRMRKLLKSLPEKNAHTIFGAVCDTLKQHDFELLPAYKFMEAAMPQAGQLTGEPLNTFEQSDLELGLRTARLTSQLDIGQTVVVKSGVILAVEAFEGTDQAILRAGELGGPGAAVIKRAKDGHDMRFDIPVIGLQTLKVLKKAGVTLLAIEAGRCILLEKDEVLKQAQKMNLKMIVVPEEEPS
jgi:DUF1009 family protein